MTWATTIARTDCQNAFVLLVGWMGCRGSTSLMPLVVSEMYLPVVEKEMVLEPRAEPTLTVIFD